MIGRARGRGAERDGAGCTRAGDPSGEWASARRRGRVDRLALPALGRAADGDLAQLGALTDGDADRQHAVVQVGLEVVQSEPVAELDLSTERAAVALPEVVLVTVLAL